MKKEKIFISLVMVLVVIFMLGTVSSFATELTVSVSDEEEEETTNSAANSIGATIKASNTTKKTNTTNTTKNTTTKNTTTNKTDNTANTANKVSNYANKTGSTSLPYAGTDTTIILVVAALGISAVYAYKKVVDYNI